MTAWTPEAPPPASAWTPEDDAASAWTPEAVPSLATAPMEFEADFEAPVPRLTGVSTALRPDAISFDYLTAYTMGPRMIADISAGVLDRAWELHFHDGGYYYRRASDGNAAWDAEVLLFADARVPREVDVAFDQQGRIFVCCEIAGHVWAYFYDTTVSAYRFADLGEGVTPRCVLDSPFDTSIGDVLVFYVNRTRGLLCYRQQRDRYGVEYDTPVADTGTTYVEDATRLRGYRVAVVHSVHDPVLGTYALRELESALYPVPVGDSSFLAGCAIQSGVLYLVIHDRVLYDTNGFAANTAPQSGVMVLPVTDVGGEDDYKTSTSPRSGTLALPIINHTLYDIPSFKFGASPRSGTLVVIVIQHTLYDVNSFKFGSTPQSGTLA